jgi:hypothetical protein
MDLNDFEAAQKRLSGMNEASSKVNLKAEFTVSYRQRIFRGEIGGGMK